jgi:hypothetical protein
MTVIIEKTNIIMKIIPKRKKLNSIHQYGFQFPNIPEMFFTSIGSMLNAFIKYINPEKEANIKPPMK